MNLRVAGTVNDSIVDGPGIRLTIFTQGCPHHCAGCHNPQTHDFNGGSITDTADLLEKIKGNPLLDGVTFSGGEPFCQEEALAEFGDDIKSLGLNVIPYTGYTFVYLFEDKNDNSYGKLLAVTDFLIDGKFIEREKDWQLKFRGSRNQRYLDCQKSLETGSAVEIEP